MGYEMAIHTFNPDSTGRCKGGWTNDKYKWIECGSTQSYSVLHDDPEAAFRELHSHGGGDCMCFEDENGPSYSEALAKFMEG